MGNLSLFVDASEYDMCVAGVNCENHRFLLTYSIDCIYSMGGRMSFRPSIKVLS